MLSDICHDTLRDVWENGTPDLGQLRRDILNYTTKPFDYPKEVTDILLAAVHEASLDLEEQEDALLTPLGLMALLLCTLRAYDHPDPAFEAGLEAELLSWWPRAKDAVARLPPLTDYELCELSPAKYNEIVQRLRAEMEEDEKK